MVFVVRRRRVRTIPTLVQITVRTIEKPSEKLANSTTNEFSCRKLGYEMLPFGEIARALRRIHLDFPRIVDVGSLASEAGMSIRLSRQLQGRYSQSAAGYLSGDFACIKRGF